MLENEARGCLVWSLLEVDFKTFFIDLLCVLSNTNVYEQVLSLKIASIDLPPFQRAYFFLLFSKQNSELVFLR